MRRLTLFILFELVLSGLLTGCGTAVREQRQPNFAFQFSYGCPGESFDSSSGTFSRSTVGTIPLTLTDGEMQAIFEKMVAIDFFSYPEDFVSTPTTDLIGIVTPATEYHLQVQNGDKSHAVRWTDEISSPVTKETEKLREFFEMIVKILEKHPELKELPPPEMYCA